MYYELEAPGVYALPPQEQPIQAQFDGERHPLLAELNQTLESQKHRYDAYANSMYGGDPFYMSGSLANSARELAAAGQVELALDVLDQGSGWDETQIHGAMYEDLAVQAAEQGKPDFALAIALDNDRLLAGYGAHRFDEVLQDENAEYRKVGFAAGWLAGASRVYRAVMTSNVGPDASLRERFLEKVDLYSEVIAASSVDGALPRNHNQTPSDTNSQAVTIGGICTVLREVHETERAAFLNNLDSEIATYVR